MELGAHLAVYLIPSEPAAVWGLRLAQPSFHQGILRDNKGGNNGCTLLNLVYETAHVIGAACVCKGSKSKVSNFYCYFLIPVDLIFPLGILTTSLVKTKITVLIVEQLFFL